ncbi:S-methyl-5'-thioadenosine phosphorylase [Methylopila jiangsuensis]|uniref:S-methyl-5'-thioadenosine phosphorylase n=1 Tax=Methylopila jiangsuensis TaxID=586230 RepID=A0A9W6JG78_9HYPH|nr:S-methyl-5'-thioadenosine phosphorylase [Methylopila jiangsuensis]MDR6285411.1 5'-methylthioadenosine phosphorylase [Methylopila jiangsuensis]GLK75169.1 S-methyl-5'-thioadenosine phosphorylase [Methylopila jiangsuensis]
MAKAVLGVIGGSGIYDLPGLAEVETLEVRSPWGEPSAPLRRGRIGATTIVFLPRHGAGHRLSPSDIDYRANIDALKRAGVTDLVSLSACGSYREDLPPGTFVLADQFIDRTFRRASSFFGAGCVAHVAFSDPVAPNLVARVARAAAAEDVPHVVGGAYVCMEGPQFSTRAESVAYKAMGAAIVGMTNMPEAKLAREAEIAYATVGMVTDYDAWRPHEAGVDVADILSVMRENGDKAARLIARLAADFPEEHEACPVGSDRALEFALVTAPEHRDPALLARLDAVAGRVLGL